MMRPSRLLVATATFLLLMSIMTSYAVPTLVSASALTPAPALSLQTLPGTEENSITCSGEFSITMTSTGTQDIGAVSVVEERSCTVYIPFTITLTEEGGERYEISDSLAGISEATASAEARISAKVIGEGSLQPSSWLDAGTTEAWVFGIYRDGKVRLGFLSPSLSAGEQIFSGELRYLNGDGKQHVVSYNTFTPFIDVKLTIEHASFGFEEQLAVVSEKDLVDSLSNSKMKFDPAVPVREVTFNGELPEFEIMRWRFSNLRYTGTLSVDEVSWAESDEWAESWGSGLYGESSDETFKTSEDEWAESWGSGLYGEPSESAEPTSPTKFTESVVLTNISGEVEVQKGGVGEWTKCDRTILEKGDRVRTGRKSKVTIKFLNGDCWLELGENSLFRVPDTDKEILGILSIGKLWAKIKGILGILQFKTPTVVSAVRGTEFTVEVDEDDSTTVTVLEGVVEVQDIISKAMVALNANQLLTIPKTAEGLNERELLQRITTIDPASIDRWWDEGLTSTQVTTSGSATAPSVGGPVFLVVITFIVILLVIALILVLFFLLRRRRARRPVKEKSSEWLETLKIRLAKGEITQEEYEELKKRLKET